MKFSLTERMPNRLIHVKHKIATTLHTHMRVDLTTVAHEHEDFTPRVPGTRAATHTTYTHAQIASWNQLPTTEYSDPPHPTHTHNIYTVS